MMNRIETMSNLPAINKHLMSSLDLPFITYLPTKEVAGIQYILNTTDIPGETEQLSL